MSLNSATIKENKNIPNTYKTTELSKAEKKLPVPINNTTNINNNNIILKPVL
jgi:hypothetical protein